MKLRIVTFFVFVGLFSAAFQIGAISEISDEDADAFVQEFLSQTEAIDGTGIFLNNSLAALPMFVPGFGMIWGLYTAWSTGFGFAAMITMAPGLSEIMPLSILYMSPFGLMELAAYSIGLSRSFHITSQLIKRDNLKGIIRPTLIEIGIVVGLLFGAGFLEEYMIKMAQEGAISFGNFTDWSLISVFEKTREISCLFPIRI